MHRTKMTAFGIALAAALAVGVVAPTAAYAESSDVFNVEDNDSVNQTILQNTEQFLEENNESNSSGNVAIAGNESSASNDAIASTFPAQISAQYASNSNSDNDTTTQGNSTQED